MQNNFCRRLECLEKAHYFENVVMFRIGAGDE